MPKFGEAPPLAIDVVSQLSPGHARLEDLRLAAAVQHSTGWTVDPDFPV